jgi:hypothetical protein
LLRGYSILDITPGDPREFQKKQEPQKENANPFEALALKTVNARQNSRTSAKNGRPDEVFIRNRLFLLFFTPDIEPEEKKSP